MCFGKSAFTFKTRGDGDLPCFGERAELVPCLGIVHALASVDHRPFGSGEYGSSLVDCNWIGSGSGGEGRRDKSFAEVDVCVERVGVGCGGSADNPTSAGSNSINSTNDSVNSTVDEQAAEGMQLVTLRLPGMT